MRPEERLVLGKDVAGELSSLLASALETKNWTVVALCRDRLNHVARRAQVDKAPWPICV
jgi:hypothetical protein